MSPAECKRHAEKAGWTVWYDRAIRLWTATKCGQTTAYWTASVVAGLDSDGFASLLGD